jgi:hypothetical protein
LTVGSFAWVGPLGQVSQSYVSGYQAGFVGRNQQALITQFLGSTSLLVPAGFPVTLFNGGDFWAEFLQGATAGATVYADNTTGAPTTSATAATATGQAGFVGTATCTVGSNQVNIVSTTSGILNLGDVVTMTGVPTGSTVIDLETYTPGGTGLITISQNATATEATEAITTTSAYVYVTALGNGALSVGDTITGTGVTAGTTITSVPSAIPGVFGLSVVQSFASTTLTSGSAATTTGFTVGPITTTGAGLAKITKAVA